MPAPNELVTEGTPGANEFILPGESRPNYVIVTSTPTPENIITVAAMAAMATHAANTVGTYTPAPAYWVTPIIVTPQPSPANTATAVYQQAIATAEAFLFGSDATPVNVWTATPTPVLVPLEGEVATPWATFTPTATPQPILPELVGKIIFLSNRSGGPEPLAQPLVYVMDPDGSNLAVLTDRTAYETAIAREPYSADQRFRVFVKDAFRFDGSYVPALYFYDYFYNVEAQITHFGAGVAWDPVWSPAREQIAFVSNDSSDDEIWVVNRDESNLRQLTSSNMEYNAREVGKDTFIPEVNGHPSWSPDGSQIVFWSNRTGNRQIWIMNADGSNPYSLSTTNHDDWNPVWVKYTDPARDPAPNIAGGSAENPP
jgi:dipeptidyl aminopeptidase/acylaminoacyl peptidase